MSSRPAPALAALLTDFGAASVYPAVMKGVMLGIAPDARIIDFTNGVPARDVSKAAFTLMVGAPCFPQDTIFVCVVDPGVGTPRKILWARSEGRQFLAPDNGLLSWLGGGDKVFEELRSVENSELFRKPVSGTFHGRDIFAPVAAHLLKGFPPQKLGPRVERFKQLPFPQVREAAGKLEGEILLSDSFGNCITNISLKAAEGRTVYFRGIRIGRLLKSYGFVAQGQPAAVESSSGFLELAVNGWSFAEKFKAEVGDKVVLK